MFFAARLGFRVLITCLVGRGRITMLCDGAALLSSRALSDRLRNLKQISPRHSGGSALSKKISDSEALGGVLATPLNSTPTNGKPPGDKNGHD